MSLLFPTESWVSAWVSACHSDLEFTAAATGWDGAVAFEVRDIPPRPGHVAFIRLDGQSGRWTSFTVGADPQLAVGATFALRAEHTVWKAVVRQEVHPVRGIIQGHLSLSGQLSEVLRWSRTLQVVARLAGTLDTAFADEV